MGAKRCAEIPPMFGHANSWTVEAESEGNRIKCCPQFFYYGFWKKEEIGSKMMLSLEILLDVGGRPRGHDILLTVGSKGGGDGEQEQGGLRGHRGSPKAPHAHLSPLCLLPQQPPPGTALATTGRKCTACSTLLQCQRWQACAAVWVRPPNL